MGQQLNQHFHLHVLVTAGGLHQDGKRWISVSEEETIFKSPVLAPEFTKIYLRGIRRLFGQQLLTMPPALQWIVTSADVDRFLLRSQLYTWRVYVQTAPAHCQGPDAALKYLAQYAGGTAIHDARVVSATETHVTIQCRDYRNNKRVRRKTFSGHEFMERFTDHILPRCLTRMRYTGLFYGRDRKRKLELCRAALKRQNLGRPILEEAARQIKEKYSLADHAPYCASCGAGPMIHYGRFNAKQVALWQYLDECLRNRILSRNSTMTPAELSTTASETLCVDVPSAPDWSLFVSTTDVAWNAEPMP